ncbi:23759_t:CDS:2 [Gigaspora margarita]|uniref:23759_t:CDS:1 n=1 Tax=Gigaspora margarita TaxID=4874 RepID=A0ABN7UN51_GIGMA|nr:23759_t:CDS:2 [Gigaspora margarita]
MLFQNKAIVSLLKALKRNLYKKKEHHAIKNAKFESTNISIRDNINLTTNITTSMANKRENIFYNPLKNFITIHDKLFSFQLTSVEYIFLAQDPRQDLSI